MLSDYFLDIRKFGFFFGDSHFMKKLTTLIFTLSVSLLAFSQSEIDDYGDLSLHISSNYKHILNSKDLYDIDCEKVIIFRGFANEAYVENVKGGKTHFYEYLLMRNEKVIDTLTTEEFKCPKGWCSFDDCFFNIFPFAGTYKIQMNAYSIAGDGAYLMDSTTSNLITVFDEFQPRLLGGYEKKDTSYIYSDDKSIVIDCSSASCMKEYFVSIFECDNDWNPVKIGMEKIYYGAPEDYIDVFTLARKVKYKLHPEKEYRLLVGPGSNVEIDPHTWFINQKFKIENPFIQR